MYKYGQQEQVTVRNHNRSTALERSLLKYWGGGLTEWLSVSQNAVEQNGTKSTEINGINCAVTLNEVFRALSLGLTPSTAKNETWIWISFSLFH